MYSPERRTLLRTGAAVFTSLALLREIPQVAAQTEILENRRPVACTFHGINGSPDSGFIADLNTVLRLLGYDVYSPQMPGGEFPTKEGWDDKAGNLLNKVRPDISFWYSLAARTMLRLGTEGSSNMGKVVSLAGRKADVDIYQFDMKNPRRYFYDGGVDLDRFVANTPEGRFSFHSQTDNIVNFAENSCLATDIKANRACFDIGQGHFDTPGKTLEFARDIIGRSREWGIV